MKQLLSLLASAAILSISPDVARSGVLYDAVITGDFQKASQYIAGGLIEDTGDLEHFDVRRAGILSF
jgi:hypothetical protein